MVAAFSARARLGGKDVFIVCTTSEGLFGVCMPRAVRAFQACLCWGGEVPWP